MNWKIKRGKALSTPLRDWNSRLTTQVCLRFGLCFSKEWKIVAGNQGNTDNKEDNEDYKIYLGQKRKKARSGSSNIKRKKKKQRGNKL